MLEHLSKHYECLAITPSSNMSGSSNSLTLKKPLLISKKSKNFYHINGSPADCIHISRLEFFNFKPDLVISGINNGFNLGTDIFIPEQLQEHAKAYFIVFLRYHFPLIMVLNQAIILKFLNLLINLLQKISKYLLKCLDGNIFLILTFQQS